jgi:hypothetical protein
MTELDWKPQKWDGAGIEALSMGASGYDRWMWSSIRVASDGPEISERLPQISENTLSPE